MVPHALIQENWNPEARADLITSAGDRVDDIQADLAAGALLFGIYLPDPTGPAPAQRVGSLVTRKAGEVLWIDELGQAPNRPRSCLIQAVDSIVDTLARAQGCRALAFETVRPAMRRRMESLGWAWLGLSRLGRMVSRG